MSKLKWEQSGEESTETKLCSGHEVGTNTWEHVGGDPWGWAPEL